MVTLLKEDGRKEGTRPNVVKRHHRKGSCYFNYYTYTYLPTHHTATP